MSVCGRNPKLSKEQVDAIRNWWFVYKNMPSMREVAQKYGVSTHTIRHAIKYDKKHHGV